MWLCLLAKVLWPSLLRYHQRFFLMFLRVKHFCRAVSHRLCPYVVVSGIILKFTRNANSNEVRDIGKLWRRFDNSEPHLFGTICLPCCLRLWPVDQCAYTLNCLFLGGPSIFGKAKFSLTLLPVKMNFHFLHKRSKASLYLSTTWVFTSRANQWFFLTPRTFIFRTGEANPHFRLRIHFSLK